MTKFSNSHLLNGTADGSFNLTTFLAALKLTGPASSPRRWEMSNNGGIVEGGAL